MTQRKATKRTASLDLDWHSIGEDTWQADLPAIPGYPELHDEESLVYVAQVGGEYTFWMEIAVLKSEFIKLTDLDFNLPNASSADEMMQEVDSLTIQDILDALTAIGLGPINDPTASRKASIEHEGRMFHKEGKHMIHKATRRIASLDLGWEETTDTFGDPLYKAVLPAIPGYPYSGDGNSTVSIGLDTYESEPGDEMYTWWMDIQVGKNDNVRFGDYELTGMGSYPLDYEMGYLDGLSVEWIADKLAEKGYEPEDAAVASRKAMRRKAGMSLDWEQTSPGSYIASLPYIPGYPCADGFSNQVEVADLGGLEGTGWCFTMYLALQNEDVNLYNDDDFGIPDTDTAEEMMDIVDNLSVQDIADVLQAKGYMPDEE